MRVRLEQLPPALRVDMVIWDRSCGYESRLNSGGEPVGNSFTFVAHELSRRIDRYRLIQSAAEVWPRRETDDGPYL